MSFVLDPIEQGIVTSLRNAGRFADAYAFVSRRLRGLAVSPSDFPGFVTTPLLARVPAPDSDPSVNGKKGTHTFFCEKVCVPFFSQKVNPAPFTVSERSK